MIKTIIDKSAAETLESVSPSFAAVIKLLVQGKQSPQQIAKHAQSHGLSSTMANIWKAQPIITKQP